MLKDNEKNQAQEEGQRQAQTPTPAAQTAQSQAQPQVDETTALLQALRGSVMPTPGGAPAGVMPGGAGGYTLEHGSAGGVLDWLLDGAAARKHREVMTHIRDTTIETLEAMNAASLITADFAANSFDTEYTMEQLVTQYRHSQMVLASAPVYVQLARQMQMQTVPAIAQAGMNRLRSKIEHR